MTIPKTLKIGAMQFAVKVVEDWPGREGCDGETFYDKKHGNVIYIGADLSEQAQEITAIHEILHCLNATMNHEFLDSLAEQIYQVLHDNKMLR